MESVLSFQTRRELLWQMVPRYRQASVSQKGVLLDEIVAITGYARRYAIVKADGLASRSRIGFP